MELKKEWGWPYLTESMWAEKLGDNLYALRNVPFYARGLSYDDRVQTEIRDELRQVVKVVDRGGHSPIAFSPRPVDTVRQSAPPWTGYMLADANLRLRTINT
jgi:hypothetical protein